MWWRALGVEPTDDKETVKKAYSALIKTIDQDKDIDTFTNVHRSYRMAMKSFQSEEKKTPEGLIDYEGQTHWYLQELAKIYNNPIRRLKQGAWKNLFACMSFIEEKHFLSEYVSFFNEHYALTEDIWALVEKYYPLSNRKDFRWTELVNGHLKVSADEIKGLPFDKASSYVTYKIHVFYAIMDRDYDRALIFLRILLTDYDFADINRWYMIIARETGMKEDLDKAYERMSKNPSSLMFADYYYSGYLNRNGDYKGSEAYLKKMDGHIKGSASKVLEQDNTYHLSSNPVAGIDKRPWNQLEAVSLKHQKLLAKGKYEKVSQSDHGNKRLKLWGGR